jgi:hypothetical protein
VPTGRKKTKDAAGDDCGGWDGVHAQFGGGEIKDRKVSSCTRPNFGPEFSSDNAGDGRQIHAVRIGRMIGLFEEYNEGVAESTQGFTGSKMNPMNQKFDTIEKAADFVRTKWPNFKTPPEDNLSKGE